MPCLAELKGRSTGLNKLNELTLEKNLTITQEGVIDERTQLENLRASSDACDMQIGEKDALAGVGAKRFSIQFHYRII